MLDDNLKNLDIEQAVENNPENIRSNRRSIILIYICTFFYWMAMYLYVPILPVYAESLGASLTVVGVIVAAYAIPQLLVRIPLGILADILGRQKPLILAGCIILMIGSWGLALSPAPLYLGICRGLVGVGAAIWVVFPVFLMSLYPQEKAGQALSILNFIVGVATLTATLLGGMIADILGEKMAFYTAVCLAMAAFISIFFTKEQNISCKGTLSWQTVKQVSQNPLLIIVSIMGALLFFAEFSSVWGFVPIYAAALGASGTQLGIITMLSTLGGMVGSLISAVIMRRQGAVWTVIIASGLLGVSLLAVPWIHDLDILSGVLLVHGLGYGILYTPLMALSMQNIAAGQRSTAMGLFQAIYAIGMLSGPLISGLLSDHFSLAVVFYVGGLACLAIIGMAYLPVITRLKKQ